MTSTGTARLAWFAFLVLAACGSKKGTESSSGAPSAKEPRAVRTAKAAEQKWEQSVEVVGELLPLEDSTIAAKAAGRLAEVHFDIGDRVKAGALLARIDPKDAELRVAQSEAAVRAARTLLGLPAEGDDDKVDAERTSTVMLAQSELDEARRRKERSATLSESGINSQAAEDAAQTEFLTSTSRLQEAREMVENRRALLAQRRADLAIARQALEDTRILAPFDGAVVERLANTGEYVAIGTPLARLVRDGSLRLRVSVAEPDVPRVRIGQELRAHITGLDSPISARITRTSPALDAQSRALLVEAEVPNAGQQLRSGSFAKVQIVYDADARALVIPVEGLVSFAGVDKVFVVESGHAREKRVDAGRREAQRVEILSGIEAGAEVVLSPGNLRDGDPVNVER